MQTVILAGGRGTRLGPLTGGIPKPMVRVAGVPYLEHQLRLLRDQNLTEIVMLTGYRGNQIEDYFGNGSRFGMRIRYSREPAPLGTGGAIRFAGPLLDTTFLVIYGDSYLPIEYSDVGRRLTASEASGVVVVYRDCSGDTFVKPNIAVDQTGFVCRYDKRGLDRADELQWLDAGVLALRRSVIDLIPADRAVSLEEQIFPALIEHGKLIAFCTDQRFYDVGTPERLRIAEAYLS